MDDKNLRAFMAEMVGTFALVFVSAGAVCVNQMGGLQPGSMSIALAAGLIYAGALAVTLPLSGGYLNPAVTLTLWVFKRLDGVKTVGLIFVQVLGAVIAGLLLRFILPHQEPALDASQLGRPHLNLELFNASAVTLVPLLKGMATELVLTFLLVFTIFGTVIDPRAARWAGQRGQRLSALWIGLVLAAVTYVGYPLTGAAVNPARWLGPAVASKTIEPLAAQYHFADQFAYWGGPIAGALIAAWLYSALILPSEEEEQIAVHTSSKSGGASTAVSSTLFRARK